MMSLISIFFCLLSQFCSTNTSIVYTVRTFSYVINDSDVVVTEYQIRNQSPYEYYTWYLDKTSEASSDEDEIKRYFFTSHQNLSLSTLLFDNVYSSDFKLVVGMNFLKQIKPGESFSYIFVNEDEDYSRNIKCVIGDTLKKYIGDIANKQFLYEGNYLVIVPKNLK